MNDTIIQIGGNNTMVNLWFVDLWTVLVQWFSDQDEGFIYIIFSERRLYLF